jgi:flagellar secretion chaperone FliS
MKSNPYQAYQQNTVMTSSPAELTLMLYDGCLKFIRQAKTSMLNGNIADRNITLQKAQSIILEFITTIDQSVPISKELLPLYDFIYRKLIEANVSGNLEALTVAEDLVVEFRDTWKEVMAKTRQGKQKASGQA